MKQRFTYTFLVMTLLSIGELYADIKIPTNSIKSVQLRGSMNGWENAPSIWYLDAQGTDKNQWKKAFYIPGQEANYEFKMYVEILESAEQWVKDSRSGWLSTKERYEEADNKLEAWSIHNGVTDNMYFTPIVKSSSEYIKIDVEFWGEYSGESRLFLTQSAVAPLSTTLPAVTLDGGQSKTLTPTTTGGSGGYKYTYEVKQGGKVVTDVLTVNADGTATFTAPVHSEATDYTVTVTTKDTHSQLSGLATTKTTTTITVNPSIMVYLDMSLNSDWTTVSIYRFWSGGDDEATGCLATKINKSFDGKSAWYSFILPLKEGIAFIVRDKEGWGGKQTVDVNLSSEDIEQGKKTGIAFSVLNTQQSSKYMVDRYGPSFYVNNHYIESKIGTVTHKSNTITTSGTLSYYTSPEATAYTLYSGNDFRGYKSTALTKETAGDVYVAEVTDDVLGKPAIYTGDFYIGTDASSAHWWTDFSALTDAQKQDALMTYFAPNTNYQDTYNYYWTKWVSASETTKANVKAFVGNPYNNRLAEVGGDNIYTDAEGDITKGANVRFGYNPQTNTLTRAMIDGSAGGTNYVSIYTTQSDQLYTADKTTSLTNSAQRFKDVSDWVYEIDVWAKPNTTAIVQTIYNNKTQNLFGETNGTPNAKTLLGNTGTGDNALYRMHVIYDFKTNRVIAGWMPETQTITGEKSVESNLMIMRKENESATQVQLGVGASLNTTKQIYTVLEVTKTNWKNDGGYFWISLPYDCYIQDIFGLEGYGTKWTIQRYRGDKRAELGWFREISTFWANMKRNRTAKMEAGRGYVVRLKLTEDDFSNVDDGGTELSALRLYFPSHESGITLSETRQNTTAVPVYDRSVLSSDKRRIADDSNWNVIGVMGFQDMHSAGWAVDSDPNAYEETETPSVVRTDRYFYKWSWNGTKGVYTLASSANNTFESTQAYMVQFGGTINWTKNVTKSGLQARKAPAQHQNAVLCLNIANEKESDNTYLQLEEEATTEYDLNSDLGKIVNEGCVQVYTLTAPRTVTDAVGNAVVEQSQLAANYLPIESQSVAVGIQAPAAGEYTFSMPNTPAGIIPTLYDSKLGATINLAFDKYTVSLEQGIDEKRFTLHLNVQNAPTSEELTAHGEWRITQLDNSILISGLEGEADIRLYDALGRMLYHTTNAHEMIPVSQTGVYLMSINGHVQRILIN